MFEHVSVEETILRLRSNAQKGLSKEEAKKRLDENGANELKEKRIKTMPERFLEQMNDPLIYVLLGAAVVSALLKEVSDSMIIGIVVLVNAMVGMIQEGKAQKALESLKKLTTPHSVVVRDGKKLRIAATGLVKGDLVCLESGCCVPADMRLLWSEDLQIEESALTGESIPVHKDACFMADPDLELPIGDRKNMAYMSTIVTKGRGIGIVTATGMDTEIGKIADFLTQTQEELTPLQKKLGALGKWLSILSLLLCGILFLIAVFQKRNIFDMLVTAISLAVAAVSR